MNDDGGREEFFALLRRFNALGRLLRDEYDPDDAADIAEGKTILAEMKKVQAQIDAIIERHRVR